LSKIFPISFSKKKKIIAYTRFILLPTTLYKVVGRYQGQEWWNKLPFKIEEGEGKVEEDKGEKLSSIRRSKDGVANAGPFCCSACWLQDTML
jgi:hypothetical protein